MPLPAGSIVRSAAPHRVPLEDAGGAAFDLRHFGARLGSAASHRTAWLQAREACGERGGIIVRVPASGLWTVGDEPFDVDTPNFVIQGPGKRNVQSPIADFGSDDVPGTLVADHTGPMFRLRHDHTVNGFSLRDVTCVAPPDLWPAACVDWDLGGVGDFIRDFTFIHCSISRFEHAFRLHHSSPFGGGSDGSIGAVRVLLCSVMHNQWAVRTYGILQINGFSYDYNESGQNGYDVGRGGIELRGHDVSICRNVLEGTRDPVHVIGAYRDIMVAGNYFEGNVGRACVRLSGARGPAVVGPNQYMHGVPGVDHKVLLEGCGRVDCRDPFWPLVAHKVSRAQERDGSLEYAEYSAPPGVDKYLARCDTVAGVNVVPDAIHRHFNAFSNGTIVLPTTGKEVGGYVGATAGSGEVSTFYLPNTVSEYEGKWLAVCWPLRRLHIDGASPIIGIRINEEFPTADPDDYEDADNHGSRYVLFAEHPFHWSPGEWCVLTAAVRLNHELTSLRLDLYPYGDWPAGGLGFQMQQPAVYVVDDPRKVRPYWDTTFAESVAAP